MEKDKKRNTLFDLIAPVYGLFFQYQVNQYTAALDNIKKQFDFSGIDNIIDIGCGTGALCSVLKKLGISVTGIDPSQKMLNVAIKKQDDDGIKFVCANAVLGLPFDSKSFDASISSYVAHGLKEQERLKLYDEMKRISKKYVILYDYTDTRSTLTSIIEYLEGGDYFNFIVKVKSELKEHFSNVLIINTGIHSALYICTP